MGDVLGVHTDNVALYDEQGNELGSVLKTNLDSILANAGASVGSPDSGSGELGWLETIADRTIAADAGEREYTHVAQVVSAAGDTVIHTPAVGKSIRLWWIYALNNPSEDDPRLITVKIGSDSKYVTYGISKRQKITGGVDESLIINLSGLGSVAVTAILEEV